MRQLDVKKAVREEEVAATEQLSAKLRDEKQREILELREKFETQVKLILMQRLQRSLRVPYLCVSD